MVDVERWRLRAAQEDDEEFAPFITLLERGERALRGSYDRSLAESTLMAVSDFEIVDGLLHRKVKTPDGEMASVPAIPDGGVKSALVNGKRMMLTWRNMILHVVHNSTAGGHPGAHATASFRVGMVASFG